ncbi:hypothetical protein [Reinekea marinisedimentorum]|uniref:hypothetical protein n=1 Tax=Reinekea marinisedimentorum TaxID=230495 RepID=UPI0010512319|nr:hypothetical protein [Reinekea marinisedimentorum]
MINSLTEALSKFRSEVISTEDTVLWVKANSSSTAQISRTSYLKLKRGNPLPACVEALPACNKCSGIFVFGEFTSYSAFEMFDDQLKQSLSKNEIRNISEPQWQTLLPEVLGGAIFYECCSCGAIWLLVLPERAQRGSWTRIA